MNIQVSALSNVALYEQIANQIKAQIIDGTLQEGALLPSVRCLAQELGVSMITTRRAYTDLERDGYVFTAPAKGTFVSHRFVEHLEELGLLKLQEVVEDAVYLAKLLNVDEQQLASLVAQRYAAVNPRADNHRTRFAKFARYNTQNQP